MERATAVVLTEKELTPSEPVAVIPQGQCVTLFAGKRKLALKPSDLDYYRGEHGRRGAKLPRGLQRVDRIEIELAAGAESVVGENQEG